MNNALADALQQLNLEPGTYRCELPEREIVVQVRPRQAREAARTPESQKEGMLPDPVTIDESCIMLDPWVELPGLEPAGTVIAHFAPPPPPDIPEIPTEDDEP